MKDPIIQLTGLTKNYGKVTAVDQLDLHIYPGEIFGLLGPMVPARQPASS